MTVICGGGASEARPGFAPVVYVGPAIIGALLNNIPTPWAVGLAAYVGFQTYELANYCTQDPPADPVLNAADAVALLTLNPIAGPIAEARFRQFIGRYLWWDLCKCSAVATPAAPAAPAKPVGWPDVNPTGVTPPVGTIPVSCHDQVRGFTAANGTFAYDSWLWRGTPANLKSFRVTIKQPTTGPANGVPVQWTLLQTGDFAIGTYETRVLPRQFEQVVEFPVVSPATELRLNGTASYAQTDWGSIEIEGFCGQLAISPGLVECCPPDPHLVMQVSQILETVTLMQRQLAPFAYVPGTAHAGLVGSGTFAIQGLLGVKVQLTTVPAWSGHLAGSPDELFDVGFVTFGVEDGYPHSVRIEHNPQVMLPARASVFTSLAYSLPPGVVATITELKREP